MNRARTTEIVDATAAILVGAALCAGFATEAVRAKAEEPRELVLLNWAEYIDPALVAKFEAGHNARVKEVFYEDEEARDQLLLEADGKGYDLALVSGRQLAHYRARGWLAPLDETNTPNLKNIEPRWRTIFPAAEGFAAPYVWGTLGIAYRADLVPGRAGLVEATLRTRREPQAQDIDVGQWRRRDWDGVEIAGLPNE